METGKYKAILRAAELGSFTAAAEELGYTTAGIGHMVEAVERDLGLRLLDRSRSGVAWNRSGAALTEDLQQIISAEIRLREHAAALRGILTGELVIGAYYSIAANWLPQVLESYVTKYPRVRVRLREGGHTLLNQWLSEGQLDLALSSYDPDLHYDWIPLREDPMIIVLPMDHPLAASSSLRLTDCLGESFIMPARGRDFDVQMALGPDINRLRITLTTVENYSALAMVERGLGISIMNELITKRLDYHVAKIPLADIPKIRLGMYVPPLKNASPAVRAMVDCFRDCLA